MIDDILEAARMRREAREFSVRRSQDSAYTLERENFNLRLKIFHLQHMQRRPKNLPRKMSAEWAEFLKRDYVQLQLENKQLRAERASKSELMRESFMCVNMLEGLRKDNEALHESKMTELLIIYNDLQRRIDWSRQRNAKGKICLLRGMNEKLLEGISEIESHCSGYPTEGRELIEPCRINEAPPPKYKPKRTKAKELEAENKQLDYKLLKARLKNAEIDYNNKSTVRVAKELSEIIESLEKSVAAIKCEAREYQAKFEYDPKSYAPVDLKSVCQDQSNKYPFHNPLFGSIKSVNQ